MQVKILGSAAGGGFPQWNCACPNCDLLRAGKFPGKSRTQAQVAVSPDNNSWFLLGASPDLRQQIEATPELHPRGQPRHSPIAGIVLSSAELDHVMGLLHLRELQPFTVYATPSVTSILHEQNSMFRMLNRAPEQVFWRSLQPGEECQLKLPSGEESGIVCEVIGTPSRFPFYVCHPEKLNPDEATVGLLLTSKKGRSVGYFPGVGCITEELRNRFQRVDLLLFDGTFWSEDELIALQGSGQRARDMGHIPVGGEAGSLLQFATLRPGRKLYIHINNTNPMLNESGPEYRAVRDAGWELAEDGWQITL
jgi:pyrroloquinoline quinone biosynthesis protein B